MIAIYLRSSTKKQDNGLETQEREIRKYLKDNGFNTHEIAVYKDIGVSGAKAKRPDLDTLRSNIKDGLYAITAVVTYSFSRLARSTVDLLNLVNEFQQNGVDFISTTQKIDTTTKEGKLMLTVFGALAEFEREMIVGRVKDGMANAKAKGKVFGQPSKYDHKQAKDLYNKGKSYAEVAKELGCSRSQARNLVIKNKENK